MAMNVDTSRASQSGIPRGELYEGFHDLAVFMAKKNSWAQAFGLTLDDLIQEAWIGIFYAWHHYDPSRDTKFSGYVAQCCGWSIKNAVRDWRFGPADYERWQKWADAGGASPRLFSQMTLHADERVAPYESMLQAKEQFDVKRREARALLKRFVGKGVSARDQSVCIRYFLLGATLEETARVYGISRERIRQIIQRAMPGVRNTATKEIRMSMRRGESVGVGKIDRRHAPRAKAATGT